MKRHLAYAALVLGVVPVLLLSAGCTSGGGLYVSSNQLEFGALSSALPLDIGRTGDTGLTWTVSSNQAWLLLAVRASQSGASGRQAPSQTVQGTGPVQLSVTVDRTGLAAGAHSGTLTITTSAGNSSVEVTTTVTAGTTPVLSVSPTALSLGSTAASGTFSVNNAGVGALTWTATTADAWITSISPASGTNASNVTVTVDRGTLAPGTHTGTVTVASSAGNATVSVQVTVPAPVLSVLPTTLDFGTETVTMNLSIRNTGGGALNWTTTPSAAWIALSEATGSGDALITVTVDRASLAVGANNGTIAIAAGGQSATVQVNATRPGGLVPIAYMGPSLLDFGTTETQKNLTVRNLGAGTLTWAASVPVADQAWLSITGPASGTGDGTIAVVVNRAALPSGSATGTVLLTSNGGNTSATVSAGVMAVPSVTPTSLDYGKHETSQTVQLTNVGQGVMTWEATATQPWITVTPDGGESNAQALTIAVDRTGLSEGPQVGAVTVQVPGAGSVTVAVRLEVNRTPVISSITAERTQVPPGAAVLVNVVASDGDDTTLTYDWTCSAGTLAGAGESVNWTAPTTPGAYTVTCEVTDPDGASATATIPITVYPTGSIDVPVS